jgi:hypothetical protein
MFQTEFVDKIKTYTLCSKFFSRKSCRLRDNVEKYGTARQATDDNITRRMRFACWITKATDTHSGYVILIALPRQERLRERASMLRYTYTVRLVMIGSVYCRVLMQGNTAFWTKLPLPLTELKWRTCEERYIDWRSIWSLDYLNLTGFEWLTVHKNTVFPYCFAFL